LADQFFNRLNRLNQLEQLRSHVVRIATYNVENLFDRAKIMNLETWSDGKPLLTAFAALNVLLGEASYTTAAKAKMVEHMLFLDLEKSDIGEFVILRRNKGALLKRPKTGGIEITANGRDYWIGSLELRDEPINHTAIHNTARVINAVDADVLAVIEAESRPALMNFNDLVIPATEGTAYRHVMVIDGNDERGIDVGLLTRADYPIGLMRSHVDDRNSADQRIFSRDCPEYEITTPQGNQITVLINHFKSKGFGPPAQSTARRLLQAQRVKAIYDRLVAEGKTFIAIVGDLNDTPDSAALQPLLAGTNLKDASTHPAFDDGGRPGTFGASTAANKIDYLLLSPALWNLMRVGGINRLGVWPGTRPAKWPVLETLQRPVDAASDHAAVWCDLDV
jgi:endonuclease/exonuclease/phosphatase family metal-dependent hydrolase